MEDRSELEAELNALANPLGHTVTFRDPIWWSAVTDCPNSRHVFLSLDPEDVRNYLERRAAGGEWWWFDDGSNAVLECLGPGWRPQVRIRDLDTDAVEEVHYVGVCVTNPSGPDVAQDPIVWVDKSNIPTIGRWFR